MGRFSQVDATTAQKFGGNPLSITKSRRSWRSVSHPPQRRQHTLGECSIIGQRRTSRDDANPAASAAVDGELALNHISKGATNTTEAKFGRIVDRDGHEVLAVDVGPEDSDAMINLITTTILSGQPVRLSHFGWRCREARRPAIC
jgi:hypothetical protein